MRTSRVVATAAAVVGLFVAAVAGASPASAHSALEASNPVAGSTVAEPPAEVVLTFNENLVSASVTLVDGCGRETAVRTAVDGRLARAALPGGTAPARGDWVARWNIVGGDGHPIAGQVPFTVSGEADCAAAGAPASAAAPIDAGPSVPLGAIAALGLVVLGAAAFVVLRRGRAPTTGHTS